MVQCESCLILFNAIPDWNILSFSNLNGIIANDRRFFSCSLQILETTGAIPIPAFPARFDIKIIVEYFEIFFSISSKFSKVDPLIR